MPTQNEKVTIPYPSPKLVNCRLRFLQGMHSCMGCPPSQLLKRTAPQFTPLGNAINSHKAQLPLQNLFPNSHKWRRGLWNAKKGPLSHGRVERYPLHPQPIIFRRVYLHHSVTETLPTATKRSPFPFRISGAAEEWIVASQQAL